MPDYKEPADRYQLRQQSQGLGLVDTESRAEISIGVTYPDFLNRPRDLSELKGQPLIRAMGKQVATVVDATAGMAQDSFLLAVSGFEVIAIERSPEIFALIEDGLRRALLDPVASDRIGNRLNLLAGNAIELLGGLKPKPDAIYLDPMYPEKKKTALPKKELQILRKVVGPDADAEELFETAMRCALKRVIVKRPHHAPPLQQNPSMSYMGKLVRFDVYLVGK